MGKETSRKAQALSLQGQSGSLKLPLGQSFLCISLHFFAFLYKEHKETFSRVCYQGYPHTWDYLLGSLLPQGDEGNGLVVYRFQRLYL